MSAYICDREHILYLVKASMSRRLVGHHDSTASWWHDGQAHGLKCSDHKRAVEVATMLWNENIASIQYRYDSREGQELPGPIGETYVVTAGEFESPVLKSPDPVQIIKSCHCYEYQSCEHPDWHESEAKAFVDALIDAACRALTGYEDAEWGAPK